MQLISRDAVVSQGKSYIRLYKLIFNSSHDLWTVMPCSVVLGYRRFGERYCLHIQGEVNGYLKWAYRTGSVRGGAVTSRPTGNDRETRSI
jgi:hypothetical protein